MVSSLCRDLRTGLSVCASGGSLTDSYPVTSHRNTGLAPLVAGTAHQANIIRVRGVPPKAPRCRNAEEIVTISPPKHPMYALTTYELRDYRRELEHALRTPPEDVAVRELLEGKLADVLAEQESRTKITSSGLHSGTR
jgi:hypothetical protein